jgi:hypothetical protein
LIRIKDRASQWPQDLFGPKKGHNMNALNPMKTGIVVALLLGGWHAIWSIFVAIGIAQWVIDFVFWIHFIGPVFKIEAFDPVRMLTLLAVTSALGFVIGYVLALLWNGVQKMPT